MQSFSEKCMEFMLSIGVRGQNSVSIQTFNSFKICIIRSAIFSGEISAVIDLADNCLVTSSGLELHSEMNGINVDNFKFESQPSRADG